MNLLKNKISTTIDEMTKPDHIIMGEEIADRIFNLNNHNQIEVIETIRKRLIKQHQIMLDQLRSYNK
jgi:hypothetical protein